MAFTKSPEVSTYQTKSIRLMREYNSRSLTVDKDPDFLNCFFNITKNKATGENDYTVVKRAGTESYYTLPDSSHRGMHYWEDEDKLYIAHAEDIYVITASTGVLADTLTSVFTTSTGDVGFTEFLYENNSVKIVATDGETLVTITAGGTVTPCADADMPSPHLPQPLFVDGYLLLVKEDTADLYNSDLDDPLAWTSGNFLTSEMFPDKILKLAKLNNYVLTFGSSSIEYFWDAAIESGSPFQRNDTPVKLYGYLGGFAQHGNTIYFMGNSSVGTPTVFKLEDFKLKEIESPDLRKYLEVLDNDDVISGSIVSFMGHDFYVLNIQDARTYVYDLHTELWTRWAFQQIDYLNIVQAINIQQDTDYCTVFRLRGSTLLTNFDPRVYTDRGTNFTVRCVTANERFDTSNQKTMHRLVVEADRPTETSNLSVSWTDDDYQSYSTARTINLNQERPSLSQLGRFRRRAFKLEYTDDLPLRIMGLEVDLNLGQT